MASIISYGQVNFYQHGHYSEVVDWTSQRIDLEYSGGSAVFLGSGIQWNEAADTWLGTGTYYAEYDNSGNTTFEIGDMAEQLSLFRYDWITIFDELLRGPDTIALLGDSDDTVFSGGGNDVIYSYRGSKYIDGGTGIDTVVYGLSRADYVISRNTDGIYVRGVDTYDLLVDVERVAFVDEGLIAFDANAAQIYRLYEAAFDRTPDTAGLSYWVAQADEGLDLRQAAHGFIASAEFAGIYGSAPSDTAFVDLLYQNVLDRSAAEPELAYWVGEMASGRSRAQVLVDFSESPENVANTASAISEGIWLV